MTEDQRVFKSIGRMFILSTKEEVVEGLKVTWDWVETERVKYSEMKKMYEKKLATATEAYKEMVGGAK